MAQEYIQASFNSGEWAPHLWSRTDLEKYRSAAALLENYFIDYRGGASTRSGTRYVIRAYKDDTPVRLIPFQAAISLGYILEFGDQYIRFHRNGAPVLETGLAITGVSLTNPCVVSVANTYASGDIDWVFISGINGTTQLNGKYFIVHTSTAGTITLYDLFGNPVDASAFSVWVSGGTVQRVYTITTPYIASDLALLKFVQNVSVMILCHPSYPPATLTFVNETNWALSQIVFGSALGAPTGLVVTTTLAGGTAHYSYIVTAVTASGDESAASVPGALDAVQDIRTVAGTNTINWNSVNGASSYNVYKSEVVIGAVVPAGSQYGFIGNTTSTTFVDSNITQDFSESFPIVQNPFANGQGVASAAIGVAGSYSPGATPTITFAPPSIGVAATGYAVFEDATEIFTGGGASNGAGFAVNDTVTFPFGVIVRVDSTGGGGSINTWTVLNRGAFTSLATTLFAQASTSGGGSGAIIRIITYRAASIVITSAGTGYSAPPTVTFSFGTATATATLTALAENSANPSVPAFYQQRLVLAATRLQPQTVYMSQPGNYYNFNTSFPVQDDDAITATIVSGQISNIKALIPQAGGLVTYTDDVNFLLNGGSLGSPVTPATITANVQSHIGCNDMPPIVVNFDALSVQSKGSSVRDSTYNFYANVYTGTDISVLSSHLFFGFTLLEWAWAEEPYKIVWAVRNDGAVLALTFIKEQEFIAWTHSFTEDGDAEFKSVATIVETATAGFQNFVYFVISRTINSVPVQYIEYFPERATSNFARDYWTVDCGIGYDGAPATNFTGGEFLVGKTCTGLADGVVIPSFVMPASGNFSLAAPASKVTVGLGFVCDIQTLFLDIGQPTIQTKQKQISAVTLRVTQALGLKVGTDESNLVEMSDLVVGNVGGMTNELVTDLVTGDARQVINPYWQEQGQIFIRQDLPFPASILGYIPTVTVEGAK